METAMRTARRRMRDAMTRTIAVASCAWPAALRVSLLAGGLLLASNARVTGETPGEPLETPLPQLPLENLRWWTGTFGEYRVGHFHGGLDFATGGRRGMDVRAPADGWIERVRASGVGYGRSLYLRTHDGRLLVFGHLDAYADPVAAWVDSLQRASGAYEQDEWPAPRRFGVRAGERIGWSGSSGAGGPHLHLEIRRGDVALNPLRAGIALRDTVRPVLASLSLEPLDDHSWVRRGAAPFTLTLSSRPETVLVEGRVRAMLRASQPSDRGGTAEPWRVGMRWQGATVEARFDSISWASEMPQIDYVYDRRRIASRDGVLLYAPRGWRPRVIRTSAPESDEAGVIEVRPGDAPQALELYSASLSGATATRTVVLRAPAAHERGPDTTSTGRAGGGALRWELAALPDHALRIRVRGVPAGVHALRFERGREGFAPAYATWDGEGWSAVMSLNGLPDEEGLWLKGVDAAGRAWWQRGVFELWPTGVRRELRIGEEAMLVLPEDAAFEPAVIALDARPADARGNRELTPVGRALRVQPAALPLQHALTVRLTAPRGTDLTHVGLYHLDDDGWSFVRAVRDSAIGRFEVEQRACGEFALFEDHFSPVVVLRAAPRRTLKEAYPRWALSASLHDGGSGVDARATTFEVDGRRVPSEWDSEDGELRWRPRVPPVRGRHAVRVIAVDRAGNRSVRAGSFVLD